MSVRSTQLVKEIREWGHAGTSGPHATAGGLEPGDWASLPFNLTGGGTARVRLLPDQRAYLYVGLGGGTGSHDLNLFEISNAALLRAVGQIDVPLPLDSAAQVPGFWSDEWPQYVGLNSGYPGAGNTGGVTIVDVGTSTMPLDDPTVGSTTTVTYGLSSGGSQTFPIQRGTQYSWGNVRGFIQVQRFGYNLITNLAGSAGEFTGWSGSSELFFTRRFMSNSSLVHHPTEDIIYDFVGEEYTLIFRDDIWPPAMLTENGPGIDLDGLPVQGLFGLHNDEPMLWAVHSRGTNLGVEIVYVDVSNTLVPVIDERWVVTGTGDLMGHDTAYSLVQAMRDHQHLLLTVRTGAVPEDFVWTLYDINIETREIEHTWVIPEPPVSDPNGTFSTPNQYGFWDETGVYLLDMGAGQAVQGPSKVVGHSVRVVARKTH